MRPEGAIPAPKPRARRVTQQAQLEEEEEEQRYSQQQEQQQQQQQQQGAADEPVLREDVVRELRRELSSFPHSQLVGALKERGLSAQGSEVGQGFAGGGEAEGPAEQGGGGGAAAAAAAGGGALPTSEREWLLADRQQQLVPELLEVAREELVSVLQQAGQTVEPLETQARAAREGAPARLCEELAARASWVLAAEEVDMIEAQQQQKQQQQQQQQDEEQQQDEQPRKRGRGRAAAAEEAARRTEGPQAPGLFYGDKAFLLDSVTGQDIRGMKVRDLREALRTLGMSEEGGRYECRDRLLTVLAAHVAVKQGDRPTLMEELAKMTLRELRDELRARGESDEGTKGELERRLATSALVAAGHEEPPIGEAEETAAAAAATAAAAGQRASQALLGAYDEAAHPVLVSIRQAHVI
ncbi:hypothetical protein MNEG_14702 [Monoraphidium neglectum]|uniref:SAP domain-containing protein n=1 Tax=Monoraphidium neglectum TaxID=145388 RepID=A0A0D2MDG5_9CHLO|nr:hypothetical protein MNEG_14702 [Monoraphidium neglectum]KIY93260.1 hypothetical protein MNEG_14702 [Monoraphidium neglectum]|eukprot:XP_013892280.1 hypothetical protein MNEG_14702 [Monoraphidium neglectum]